MFTILLCYFSVNIFLAVILYFKIKDIKLPTHRKVDRVLDMLLFGLILFVLVMLFPNKEK